MLPITISKDTRLFLVLVDNEKICEALTNSLWGNLLEVQTAPVVDLRVRNAFLQFFAEFVCSLNREHTGNT